MRAKYKKLKVEFRDRNIEWEIPIRTLSEDDLRARIRSHLDLPFRVEFETLFGDARHIGVSVLGVPKESVRQVEQKILDLNQKLFSHTDFVMTPLVRDEFVTRKYRL